MNGLIGKKQYQIQGFLQDGTRVPLTAIYTVGNMVTQLKTQDKEGYNAIQLGFEIKKKNNKAITGHSKKAGLEETPRFFSEIRLADAPTLSLGAKVLPSDVFKPGDLVDVTGVSKGKGFAGGVKRHHFKGGPKTHGQSDRERAPGSIGQTTTPGRVYKGKRMAGRMGHGQITARNLQVIEVNDEKVLIKGLIPGGKNNIVIIKKVGESKKFTPLYKEEAASKVEAAVEEIKTPEETVQTAVEEVKTPEENVKTVEEKKEEVKDAK